jgi:hypothetical protein
MKREHELSVAKDFAKFISNRISEYSVLSTPDPPDAILKSSKGQTLWVEITDVFRSTEEAKFAFGVINDLKRPNIIVEPDQQINIHTVIGIEKKFNKTSYSKALNDYGKGILILWVFDPLFTDSTLSKIQLNFEELDLISDYFFEVYIYWPSASCRVFTKIWSGLGVK